MAVALTKLVCLMCLMCKLHMLCVHVASASCVRGCVHRQCKPTHGLVPAFDPSRAPSALANAAPLSHWVASAPWKDQAVWRRVPVLIKVSAGIRSSWGLIKVTTGDW